MTPLEKQVREELYSVWAKEAIRIENHNQGWERRTVSLGKGMLIVKGNTPISHMIETIEDFGIKPEPLQSMKLSTHEITTLYNNITSYRKAVRFLKDFKDRIGGRI